MNYKPSARPAGKVKKRLAPQLVSTSTSASSIARSKNEYIGSRLDPTASNGFGGLLSGTRYVDFGVAISNKSSANSIPRSGIDVLVYGNKVNKDSDDSNKQKEQSDNKGSSLAGTNGGQTKSLKLERPKIVDQRICIPHQNLQIGDVDELINVSIGVNRTLQISNRMEPTKVSVLEGDNTVWVDFLEKKVQLVAYSSYFIAAGTVDGVIHLWSHAGRRLMAPLKLESRPWKLRATKFWLACVTEVGTTYQWNILEGKAVHKPISLSPLFDSLTQHTDAEPVQSMNLLNNGILIFTLSSCETYTVNRKLNLWMRVSDEWWAINSEYWSSLDSLESPKTLTTIEDSTNSQLVQSTGRERMLHRAFKNIQGDPPNSGILDVTSLSHLEVRLASIIELGSWEEYRIEKERYIQRLEQEDLMNRAQGLP